MTATARSSLLEEETPINRNYLKALETAVNSLKLLAKQGESEEIRLQAAKLLIETELRLCEL